MVDCGFTVKEFSKRIQRFGIEPEQLDAILVTHEHQDHIGGVGPVSRKFRIPVWGTRGTLMSQKLGNIEYKHIIHGFEPFDVASLSITPLSVPHDAREPCQFMFEYQQKKLAILTDLGSYTIELVEHLQQCHALLLECNHDEDMLWNGAYPERLKQRVASSYGHLSNRQAIEIINKLNCEQLQFVIATHLSEKNNCPDIVRQQLSKALGWQLESVKIADQNQGFDWHRLA
ncbi:MAG: MBL fold metallo-hydrolase [Kangiellaceae bacterium]|nr:MBL fold metallo-hydrolase [Kangiellaceae bacterium]